jgi:Xaa-Pro dipeptidase
MNEHLDELYQQHLQELQQRAKLALASFNLSGLLIHSGELLTIFDDDHSYPFKVHAQFKAWLPIVETPNCWLWVDGVNKPTLWFYQPVDYWHKVDPLPDEFWCHYIDVIPLHNKQDIAKFLPSSALKGAYLGPAVNSAQQLGFKPEQINPAALINWLDYFRAIKTDYELFAMRTAQKIAVAGHNAARDAFYAGESEYAINHLYLQATGQRESNVPYGNIVALNQNAAILHYTQLEKQCPAERYSFLLDAGASYLGYAADITRSYAAQTDSLYGQLVAAINHHELELVASLQVGDCYIDYHKQMNHRIAQILLEFSLVKGLSTEALVEQNITSAFMPHGLGHLLGLQVHDVGGFLCNSQGGQQLTPEQYPWLRCTRTLQPRMVLTIEPGLYFIESLIGPWRESSVSHHFQWSVIDSLKPYGGIRIEDNIVIWPDRIENMTRDLNLR